MRWLELLAALAVIVAGSVFLKAQETVVLCDPAVHEDCPGPDCLCAGDTLEVVFDETSSSLLEYETFQPGRAFGVTVFSETASAVAGWAYGITHDGDLLTLTAATTDGTTAGDLEPAFDATSMRSIETCLTPVVEECPLEVTPGQRREGGGWISAVVLSFTVPVELPLGRNSLARATYELAADAGVAGTTVAVSNRLAVRNSPPARANLTADGKLFLYSKATNGLVRRKAGEGPAFRRGDANADGVLDLSDAVWTLRHLFLGSPAELACQSSADSDDSGSLEVTDAIRSLRFLFLGGPALPDPFGECGVDPTADGLSCEAYPACLEGR